MRKPPILKISKRVRRYPKNRCFYCHATDELTIDHIHPRSKGGTDTYKNRQVLCYECNQEKGSMSEQKIERMFRWFKRIEQMRDEPLNY